MENYLDEHEILDDISDDNLIQEIMYRGLEDGLSSELKTDFTGLEVVEYIEQTLGTREKEEFFKEMINSMERESYDALKIGIKQSIWE